jgi:hypothetical protein
MSSVTQHHTAANAVQVQLVFKGECIDGRDPQEVRRVVSAALKLDEARSERLFCGRPVVLKRQVDLASAARHIARFSSMGAVLRVQPVAPGGPGRTHQPAQAAMVTRHPWVTQPFPFVRSLGLLSLCLAMLGAFVVGEKLGQRSQTALEVLPAPETVALALPLATAATEPAAPLAESVAGVAADDELTAQLSPQAALDYQRGYSLAKWHRAFAVSDSGAHAWVGDVDSEGKAREVALQRCEQLSGNSTCRVVDVNGQQLE